MEPQARKSAQFDPGSQGTPQESTGRLATFQDFGAANRSFDSRNIDIGEGQFAIHYDISDKDLMQARIADLADEQFREILANPV